jgi:hypothetical protein
MRWGGRLFPPLVAFLLLLAPAGGVAGPRPAGAVPDDDPANNTYQTNGRVNAVVYLGNTVYIGGSFTAVRPPGGGGEVTRNRLAAFNAGTGALLSWNPNANNTIRAMKVSPAGTRVYVAGAFTSVGGVVRARAAALHPTSGAAFGWDPYVNDDVKAITTSNSGATVYLGGDFDSAEGAGRRHLAAINATSGALSTTFKPVVTGGASGGDFATVLAMDVSADGNTLYFGGDFDAINGSPRRNSAAVSTGIATLRTWRPSLTSVPVASLDVSASGRTVFIGGRGNGGFVHAYGPTAGGSPVWAVASDGDVEAVRVSSSLVYVGGHFNAIGGVSRGHLAALRAAGGGVQPWNPDANGVFGVYGIALHASNVGVGGEFTVVSGEAHQGFAQFPGTP